MRYKAIFFDRDGTLTKFNEEKELWRDIMVSAWSEKAFEMTYDKMMSLFKLASEGKKPWYTTLDDEREFFKRYYRNMLIEAGVKEDLNERAELLFNELWCNNDRLLFPEVVEVLEYFYNNGYKMGVISDTSPSLEYTLQQLGIAKYFTSFTASSLVGASKPGPTIFNAALFSQGVTAEESLYVDDCKPEADGAREQGFTSFHIDRSGESKGKWTISDLIKIVDYVEEDKISEIEYYKSLPVVFNGFIDFPHLTDGQLSLVCTAKKPAIPEKNYVPAYEFAVFIEETKIGEVNLRIGYFGFGPDNSSLYYSGQLGYCIEEKYRGKGYAGRACRLLCRVAEAHGMKKLLITNNADNISSRRVCEKLGLRHIRYTKLPEWTDIYKSGQRYLNIYEMDTKLFLKH